MYLRYRITEGDVKRQLKFGAFQSAWMAEQIGLCFAVLLYVILAALSVAPPVTWRNLLIAASVGVVVFAVLYGKVYQSFLNTSPLLEDIKRGKGPVILCSFNKTYISFSSEGDGGINDIARYCDISRMKAPKSGIYLMVNENKRTRFFFIPSTAFSTKQDYKEAKQFLKAAVKEYRRPETKGSIFGSFAKGMAKGYLKYVSSCLKLLLVVIIAFAVLLVIMQVMLLLK